ncbi:hypothetical protein ACO2Q3_10535 [Caulobacter sp. KR2-114]|uniref:hypothetical protein n=1 Tax=Caulobacter sp. KR2-114 TaxID=3400912 RepID=UPI003C0DBDAF
MGPVILQRLRSAAVALGLTAAPALAHAQAAAPFDLAGPTLHVSVTHDGRTLPIAEVPNLAAGDQLSIRADLSADQSAPYLLVAAFLRGATNPPPKKWFFQVKTWTPEGRAGLAITVPPGARQALVFLAPRTGGDFDTLVGAVRGRPGAFVRASQDLYQTALDRTRLDAFLTAVGANGQHDPTRLATISPLLARSLAIKLNADCLDKIPDLQAACLSSNRDALVLNDGHSASVAQSLTSGASSELIQQLGATPRVGGGEYGIYVDTVMDIVRVLDSLHTAQYQYIPAVGDAAGDTLKLALNTAPSFHAPLSVLVTALPPVATPQLPTLRLVDPAQSWCANQPDLVLPVEGAPLTFSTPYAHDLALRLKTADGQSVDLPARADPSRGGLVVDARPLGAAKLRGGLDAVIAGQWGFTSFEGPRFRVQSAQAEHWGLASDQEGAITVGHDATVRLQAAANACVSGVTFQDHGGDPRPVEWKRLQPGELQVTLPLQGRQPGPAAILVRQWGLDAPDVMPLQTYAEAGRLEGFSFHAGDTTGVLSGSGLDEVKGLSLDGAAFAPIQPAVGAAGGEISLAAADPAAVSRFAAGAAVSASVTFKDGRSLPLKVTVGPPRPNVALIAASLRQTQRPPLGPVQLADRSEVPAGATLVFAVQAETPASFSGDEVLEVSAGGGAAMTTLTFAGGLVLQDTRIAVATLDTRAFPGASAFGPLRFRLVKKGVASDWQPLAQLVRVPALKALECGRGGPKTCELAGARLFLIQAVSTDPGFKTATSVPDGFTGETLSVPRPTGGKLYLKLRDAPAVANLAEFGKPRAAPAATRPSRSAP